MAMQSRRRKPMNSLEERIGKLYDLIATHGV